MTTSARVSCRISIRWPPKPASEPTDTLVLSLGGYYVDLRILKQDQTIDWALAGERIVVSEDPCKVKFTHIINSQQPGQRDTCADDQNRGRDEAASPAEDIGDFVKLPNGDDFETGEMAAPHLGGKISPYEEVWRQLNPLDSKTSSNYDHGTDAECSVAWILESLDVGKSMHFSSGNHDGKMEKRSKTFFARIGRFFLAVRKTWQPADDGVQHEQVSFSAVRQEFVFDAGQWQIVYAVGNCTGMALSKEGILFTDSVPESWKVGGHVTVGENAEGQGNGEVCIVRAVSSLTVLV